jgi:hypothetical protein
LQKEEVLKMGRRGFLGLLTGIAAAPEIMKSYKRN